MKVLVLSHGHPGITAGGAERASYSLFSHLKVNSAVSEALYVARAEARHIGHDGAIGAFRGRADELLVNPPAVDWFTQQSTSYDRLKASVVRILERFRPDIVHIHHYSYWGLEIFEICKLFGAKVIFTMHEFMALCHNNGQMVKTQDHRLCYFNSPAECAQCFPHNTSGAFFIRQQLFSHYLQFSDCFLAPSEFLKKRYVAWGLKEHLIHVIENPLPPTILDASQYKTTEPGEREYAEVRLGFFGQLNPYKGILILLRAIKQMKRSRRKRLSLGIHGANLEMQNSVFQDEFRSLTDELKDCVNFFGPYENDRTIHLMRQYDWIVVPSIWWENSPVVIQEAKTAGVRLLTSNIGGMAEKLEDNTFGETFSVGDPSALRTKIERISSDSVHLSSDGKKNLEEHLNAVSKHIERYRSLL